MPDPIMLGLSAAGVIMVPLGAVIRKASANEKRLTILETEAEVTDKAIARIESKLDRLIEKFL